MSSKAEILSRLTLPPTNNTNTIQASSTSNLPSQPIPNPRGNIDAITLRSGTTLEEVEPKPIKLAEDAPNVEVSEIMEIDEDDKEEEITKEEEEQLRAKEPKRKSNLEEQIPIHFPTLAKKAKKHEELDPNRVQIFKNVEVTIALFDAIHQVPKYAKFLKDVCTHKEKIGVLGMNLLGSCVSIMPLSIYEKLNLAPLRRSRAKFVLADKSIISVVDDVIEEQFGSDDEISVSRNLGIRGVSKKKGKDPRLPYPQANKAPNHGSIDK
ncbi:hypothetical protein AHAS_Ahas19G0182400 [Arachis hypogaea]